jgi:tRNA-Thr(GGU) m(6)t(6)A37 methyltransferase TsaA
MSEEREAVRFRPIGIIHTPFANLEGMPIQPTGASGVPGQVELFPEFREGLQDLEEFSHVILLYHFHRSRGYALEVVPFMDSEKRGLFSTRAPRRPNPLGLSVVRLLGIEEGILRVEGVDILDGTPLLDIKPFVPDFDASEELRLGWLEEARKRAVAQRSDGRFL